jgi:thioredoxin 1
MKNLTYLLFTAFAIFFNSCTNGQTESQKLNAKAFAEQLKQHSDAVIIDVRTPDEFAGGHIANALNIDWNGSSFEQQANKLDKEKPVYVYCLKGGRSASASAKLNEMGFKKIFELEGGMLQWRAENMPESHDDNVSSNGITIKEYEKLLDTEKYVLVDFYAEWCGPCKLMKPSLEEISKELSDKVNVVRIDVDANQELAATMKIQALPTVVIYKNKKIVYNNIGFTNKATIVEQLK